MRKTVLYWSSDEIKLLPQQINRLKALQAIHPELILQSTIPARLSHRYDYICMTSSSSPWQNCEPQIIGFIIYCLHLNHNKQKELLRSYPDTISIIATNNFNAVIQSIINYLGYAPLEESQECINENFEDRFVLSQQNNKQQQLTNPQQYSNLTRKILLKLFQLDFKIQSISIEELRSRLEVELKKFLKMKKTLIIEKQFQHIRKVKSILQLCKACIYFYSLEKGSLYYNLNLIFKNLRYVKFQQQFLCIKLFAFLLLLNYFFVYSDEQVYAMDASLFYRFTDYLPPLDFVGKVVCVTNFYSVTQCEQLHSFQKKKYKYIIHPMHFTFSLSLHSKISAYKYSAFTKQKQYIYAPFCKFKILSIQNKVVHLQQMPNNQFLREIISMNLDCGHQSKSYLQWQSNNQLKYEKSINENVKLKVYNNLGTLNYNQIGNYSLANSYFEMCLNLAEKKKNVQLIAIEHNNLGLTSYKMNKITKAKEHFQTALEKWNNSNFISNVYNNLASVEESEGNFELAIKLYEKGLHLLNRTNKNSLKEASFINNIGFCIGQIEGKQKQALLKFEQCKKSYEEIYGIENCQYIGVCEQNMGDIEQKLGNYKIALKHYQLCQSIELKLNSCNTKNYFNVNQSIARVYSKMKDYQKALSIYEQSQEISRLIFGHHHLNTAINKCNIASMYESLGHFQTAKHHYDECIQILMNPYRQECNQLLNKVMEMRQLILPAIQS